jgi:hypothetical protein
MPGEAFLGKAPPDGFREAQGIGRSFTSLPSSKDKPGRGVDAMLSKTKRRVADDEQLVQKIVADPSLHVDLDADGKTIADPFDAALSGAAQKILDSRRSPREKHAAYLAERQANRVEAEAAQKTARQEQRWAMQEERDAKLRAWLESKTDEQISSYLASDGFDKLSDRQQAVIHGVLDEIQHGYQAEVELAIEEVDNESFELPEDESTDEDESFSWLDEEDDDETGGEMDIAYR